LESAVKKIADGNLDFQLEVKGSDEVAALSSSFEKMRETLKDDHGRKSRFLMAVSHDLKTPLTSIKGYLEAINDGMASDAQTQKKYLDIISEKASALEKRISDLIDFAGMETGEWQLKRKIVPLKAFLDSLSIIYREDCEILGKKFIYENTIPEKYEISCDPVLFERALENHFTNALRYTFDGAVISLRCFMENGKPVIEIADNGKGIDEKELKYIFEPFYRGSSSRREPGMGLGLSTSKSIFQSHGWEVSAAASTGQDSHGTVFRISLI
ncbi:MAG: HAMP domain-containing sensor histidine kinase, partial [Spirochaetia bacterium]|nr:HAMP domain-containing sensor histidine kinase [Spirochaetia bacterium]